MNEALDARLATSHLLIRFLRTEVFLLYPPKSSQNTAVFCNSFGVQKQNNSTSHQRVEFIRQIQVLNELVVCGINSTALKGKKWGQ